MALEDSYDYTMQPEQPKKLNQLMSAELDRVARLRGQTLELPRGVAPVSLASYKDLCARTLRGAEVLPEKLLQARLARMDQDAHLKEQFPEGFQCILAVIPFSEGGSALGDEEIASGNHVRRLLIHPTNGNTVQGFGVNPSFISRFLPQDIQNVSFTIPPYENPDDRNPSAHDREAVKRLYSDAYRKLQELFRLH